MSGERFRLESPGFPRVLGRALEPRWHPAFWALVERLRGLRLSARSRQLRLSRLAVFVGYLAARRGPLPRAWARSYRAWLARRGVRHPVTLQAYERLAGLWLTAWEEAGGPSRERPPARWQAALEGLEPAWRELARRYAGALVCQQKHAGQRLARLAGFWSWLAEGQVAPAQLDGQALARFWRQLQDSAPSRRSLARATHEVRAWLRFAQRHLLIPGRAEELPVVRLPRCLDDYSLTLEQVQALLAAPDRRTPAGLRQAAMLEVAYGCGLRKSELLGLDVEDLDLGAGWLTVRRAKYGKERQVPLGPHALAAVRAYLETVRPLWHKDPREPALWLSQPRGTRLARFALPAGLGFACWPHRLRHSYATHLLAHGLDLATLGWLLGHADLASTCRYAQVSPLELQRVHRRCHPRG